MNGIFQIANVTTEEGVAAVGQSEGMKKEAMSCGKRRSAGSISENFQAQLKLALEANSSPPSALLPNGFACGVGLTTAELRMQWIIVNASCNI